MNPEPTPADTLRRAATMVRELATAATPGPWVKRRGPGEHVYGEAGGTWVVDVATRPDMRHIAAWSPPAALAVADWLEAEAEVHDPDGGEPRLSALALAWALLGEAT